MTDDQVIGAMELYGGSFVSALGHAARYADLQNLARLKAAFPDYWKQYSEIAAIKLGRSQKDPGGES